MRVSISDVQEVASRGNGAFMLHGFGGEPVTMTKTRSRIGIRVSNFAAYCLAGPIASR
jgi:hypothetical protein